MKLCTTTMHTLFGISLVLYLPKLSAGQELPSTFAHNSVVFCAKNLFLRVHFAPRLHFAVPQAEESFCYFQDSTQLLTGSNEKVLRLFDLSKTDSGKRLRRTA